MTNENAAAPTPHQKRRGPSGNSAITIATVVTDAATACPDGSDAPVVWTNASASGGRGRS